MYFDPTEHLVLNYKINLIDLDEEFKYIRDSKGYYVSNYGRVFKEAHTMNGKTYKGKFISRQWSEQRKRFSVNITNKDTGKSTYCTLSLLVAEYFIPNPEHYSHIRFKDKDPSNVIWTNIEWVSKTQGAGEKKSKKSLYHDQYIWVDDFGWARYTLERASQIYKIDITDILDITNNKNKTGIIPNISYLNKNNGMVYDTGKGVWEKVKPGVFDVTFTFITPEQCKYWYKTLNDEND